MKKITMEDIEAMVDTYQALLDENQSNAEKYKDMDLPQMVDWCEGKASAYSLVICDIMRRFYGEYDNESTKESKTEAEAD